MAIETLIAGAAPAPASPLLLPRDPHTVIWRYLNFSKFVALLEDGVLFFPYTEQFSDALEGADRRTPQATAAGRRRAAVSSWHASDHESEAMWRLYSPIQEALALRSTYARLRRELPEYVRIHLVQYADAPHYDEADPLAAFFYKRKAYEHEKELRAVIDHPPAGSNACAEPSGWGLPIDVQQLVECVYLSPFAQDWFHGLVQKVCSRYRLDIPVERSELTGTIQR